MKRLTEKQQNILNFIEDFTREHEISPTVHELAEHFNIKSSTMFIHLRTLQRKKCLIRTSKARSIKLLTPDGKPMKMAVKNTGAMAVPFIKDFQPEMIADPADFAESKVYLNRGFCPNASGARLFAVEMDDDSLTGMNIMEGDILIIAPLPKNIPGSLVMVEFDKKARIGIIKTASDGRSELHFANPGYAPLRLPFVQILGSVIGLQRKFNF